MFDCPISARLSVPALGHQLPPNALIQHYPHTWQCTGLRPQPTVARVLFKPHRKLLNGLLEYYALSYLHVILTSMPCLMWCRATYFFHSVLTTHMLARPSSRREGEGTVVHHRALQDSRSSWGAPYDRSLIILSKSASLCTDTSVVA